MIELEAKKEPKYNHYELFLNHFKMVGIANNLFLQLQYILTPRRFLILSTYFIATAVHTICSYYLEQKQKRINKML